MNIEETRKALENIATEENDAAFAADLAKAILKYGRLTDKQAYWAGVLIAKHNAVTIPVSGLTDLITLAQSKGAKKISFALVGGDKLSVRQNATAVVYRGEYPNGVRVASLNLASGKLETSDNDLAIQIKLLAANPLAYAVDFGALTGACCFCSKELTTKESVGAGYGPVCAGKFGLPWGSVTAYDVKKQELNALKEPAGV